MTTAFPLVSILVPVYNRVGLIAETVGAALAQTYPSFEVVVCDNCSTDGTWEALEVLAASDQRLRIFRHPENLGPVRNWLGCVANARGELGKILWSDDLISPEFLTKTVPWMRDPEIGFVYSAARIFETDAAGGAGAVVYDQLPDGAHATGLYIEGALMGTDFPFSPGCALFRMVDLRRNLWLDVPNRVGSDFSRHAIGNDLLVFLLTASDYPRFATIGEPLAQFRSHGGSISVAAAAGRLPLHYDIARASFVERATLPASLVRRFNAKLWVDLRRYDGTPYGLRCTTDFFPTRRSDPSWAGVAGFLVQQASRKWLRSMRGAGARRSEGS